MTGITAIPTFGIVAVGAMGSAVAAQLTKVVCTVLMSLDGCSEAIQKCPCRYGTSSELGAEHIAVMRSPLLRHS